MPQIRRMFKNAMFLIASVALCVSAMGQETEDEDDIFELSPFDVDAEEQTGYYSANALSGTRFRTPLIDTPMSIQVITSDLMEDIDSSDITDALRFANNVQRVDNGSTQSFAPADFTIRGFGTPVKRNGMESRAFVNSKLIERVEVAKGPQSVLYGQASPGGVVNYITKKALFKPGLLSHGKVSLTGGERGYQDYTFDFGGTVSNRLGWRLVSSYKEEGDIQKFAEKEDFLFYPTLTWRANEAIQINVQYERLRRKQAGRDRTFETRGLGLRDLLPNPDGRPASEIDPGSRGRFFLDPEIQEGDVPKFGDDPRKLNLDGPIDKDTGRGQFIDTDIPSGEIVIRFTDNLTYRLRGQFALVEEHGKQLVADILNFRPDARTGDISPRWRQWIRDREFKDLQSELLYDADLGEIPIIGLSNIRYMVGFERRVEDFIGGQVETPRNTAQVVPIEGAFPSAFQDMLDLNGLTRQDLVDRDSELLGGFDEDPRLALQPPPDSEFLNENGTFARGDTDKTHNNLKAFYSNAMFSMFNNRFRLTKKCKSLFL